MILGKVMSERVRVRAKYAPRCRTYNTTALILLLDGVELEVYVLSDIANKRQYFSNALVQK